MNRPVRKKLNPDSLLLIGIPKKFISCDISDFKVFHDSLQPVKDTVQEYIKNLDSMFSSNSGILFSGSNGVGKTMLASIILKEAYRHRYSCRRTTFVEYLDSYTRMWNSRSLDEKDLVEQDFYSMYKAVEFLVLEELGKEIDSKVAAPILEDCLRYREEHGLVTIICTNLPVSVIERKYGASCFSLLKGNTTPIRIEGEDHRPVEFSLKKRGK